MLGEIKFEYRKPKYKIDDVVYFIDWQTEPMTPIIRKGKVVYAGDKISHSYGIMGVIRRSNKYIIESEGIIYKYIDEYFISKNKKKLEQYN